MILNDNSNFNNKLNFISYKCFSTQDSNNNPINEDNVKKDNLNNNEFQNNKEENVPLEQTDLILKAKKKKKRSVRVKSEEGKKSNSDKNLNENQSDNLQSEKKEKEDVNKNNNNNNNTNQTIKLSKEEKKQIQKQNYKSKIKEQTNLKDMYEIKSSKMGPINPREFFNFTKFKYPNVSVKIYDRSTFIADEKLDKEFLTPISPKLGPFIVKSLF